MGKKFQPGAGVLCQELDGETVLLDLASGSYYSLGGTGSRIWELLAAGGAPEDIVARLVEEYAAPPEQIARDVDGLLTELERHGLVQPKAG
jgi:hypothetical protein